MFAELCKAILLEAGFQIYRRDFTDFYRHNPNLPMRRPSGRAWYAQHAVIR